MVILLQKHILNFYGSFFFHLIVDQWEETVTCSTTVQHSCKYFCILKNPRLLDPASKFLASVVKSCLLQNLFSFALGEYIYKVVCKAQWKPMKISLIVWQGKVYMCVCGCVWVCVGVCGLRDRTWQYKGYFSTLVLKSMLYVT